MRVALKSLLAIPVVTMLMSLTFCSKTTPESEPEPKTDPSEEPVEDAYLNLSADVKSVSGKGDKVVYTIETNLKDLVCEGDGNFFLCDSQSSSSAVFSLQKLNFAKDETVNLSFTSKLNPEVNCKKSVVVRAAKCIDVEFNKDGSAKNVAPLTASVNTVTGGTLFTYYNEEAGRYVARFSAGQGSEIDGGFYKIDYSSSTLIKNRLEDGFSIEAQFMMSGDFDADGEVKVFSSMQNGGFGIMICNQPGMGEKDLTFLSNTSPSGSSKWNWARSGVVPEAGKYYHVIGVWDKAGSTAKVYVNGEIKGTISTQGDLNYPESATQRWLCVGGDPSGNSTAESAWRGDVVLARVYDAVLTDEDVAELWEEADKPFSTTDNISNILYLPECTIAPSSPYTICGNGFKTGDVIRLTSFDDVSYDCATTVYDDKVEILIPADLTSGNYKINVVRGTKIIPVGSVTFTIEENAPQLKAPKVAAHRGYHYGNTRPENSIAALKAAQEGGFWGSETDTWITTDGEVFINHDGVIGGVTIQKSTAAEVRAVTLANGEPVPTFEEYLAQAKKCPSTTLVIEIKEHSTSKQDCDCIDKVMQIVEEMNMQDYVCYIGFSFDDCLYIHEKDPDAYVGYLNSDKTPDQLYDAGIMGVDFSYSVLFSKPEYFKRAHELGMEVNIWTVDSEYDMLRAIGLGADIITTNYPEKLQAVSDKLFN